ncbi:MAG: golvesin C-terminal-like domain-containing protein [Paludibacteraceae bacterium]
MFSKNKYIYLLIFFFTFSVSAFSQTFLTKILEDSLTNFGKRYANAGNVKISKLTPDKIQQSIILSTNDALSYLPLRPGNVDSIYTLVKKVINSTYPNYSVRIYSDEMELQELIPGYFRKSGKASFSRFTVPPSSYPLKRNLSQPYRITEGLQNRHLAIWQSHGKYYNQSRQEWMWQRPVVFQTVEDLYTQSYVLPFLVPMLENAGANVLLPRERDTQLNEVIVDADKSTDHSTFESNSQVWTKGSQSGFADLREAYTENQNPFRMGFYVQTNVIDDSVNISKAIWTPDIPKEGRYAVYISYKTLPNSTRDARFIVKHKGGETRFSINQTMGGGTWIYLGHFDFEKGKNKNMCVELSNFSSDKDRVITADAVKIGGGMGNIARKHANEVIKITVGKGRKKRTRTTVKEYSNYSISHYPRYTEGARYWLQWAGVPDSIYSRTEGTNDYSDDFQSRGFWVNYLAGGSSVMPRKEGLNIPIDMAFAFHSDAGTNKNDSIIGTLGIFTVDNTDKKKYYSNGISRWNARELTDIIQSQIVNDIKTFYPDWNRRGLWDKNYSESRVPEVPTMLLELLSHQNFADMRLGQDPRFRFMVSRAVYKGMLRYLATANNFEYAVQPLPVKNFSTRFSSDSTVELSWDETPDKLEPTAKPDSYIVYTRMDDNGFDNGILVRSTKFTKEIEPGQIYSFKIEAVNQGGKSFPSEILSVCKAPNKNPAILIVNGFNRVSGPADFSLATDVAGFNNEYDAGVPYMSDISFTGRQTEFRRYKPYINDENVGFGASNKDFANREIAGNTFDYPFIHGKSIKEAGYSFVSANEGAVVNGSIKLIDYKIVDLILGKERQRINLSDSAKKDFKTFVPEMRQAIEELTEAGGNLLVSGSNMISDLVLADKSTNFERNFIENTLKVKWYADKINNVDNVEFKSSVAKHFQHTHFNFYSGPNIKSYYVEAPDVLIPADKRAVKICEYQENGYSAGIAYKEKYGICAFGFPFETITSEEEQKKLMKSVLEFFMDQTIH